MPSCVFIFLLCFVAVVNGQQKKPDAVPLKAVSGGRGSPPLSPDEQGNEGAPDAKPGNVQASGPRFPFPFPYDCDAADNSNSKYLTNSCKTDTECFGGSEKAMVCKKGVCTCNDNYIPDEQFLGEAGVQKVCVPAPSLFSICKDTCVKPTVCKVLADGSNSDKVCQCEKPYKVIDNLCMLECKSTEFYDETSLTCLPRCKANELKINSTCKPVVNLGGTCETSEQCQTAYSECKNKKCTCRSGFDVQSGNCVDSTVSCPSGEALKTKGELAVCKVVFVKDTDIPGPADTQINAPKYKDEGCPSTHFCLTLSQRNEPNAIGYCCPKLNVACPVGLAHPSAQCQINDAKTENCPYETHYCHSVSVGNFYKQVCCPKACSSSSVAVGDKCYSTVNIGDTCNIDEQCNSLNADCIKGVCQCSSNSKKLGSGSNKYCNRECASNEILYNNDCYSAFNLGDKCDTQPWRCPSNSFCNSKRICVCNCGMFTLAKNTCASQPTCPSIGFGFGGNSDGAMSAAAPGFKANTITEAKRKELLKNVTFCTIKSVTPPDVSNKVDKCPKNQYCAIYISNLGICCKRPDAICFDNQKPASDKSCDVSNPLSCGVNQQCYQYLSLADPDSDPTSRICCKLNNVPPPPVPLG